VLLAQEQQKAKHLSSIGSPLSPEQGPPASVSQRISCVHLVRFCEIAVVARDCYVAFFAHSLARACPVRIFSFLSPCFDPNPNPLFPTRRLR
jgi:hypothetical protein